MKKEKIKKVIDQFKTIFQKFPSTFITTILLTLFYAIVLDASWIKEKTIINITVFGSVFTFTSLFIESILLSKHSKRKTILYFIAAMISLIFTLAINHKGTFFWLSNLKYIEYVERTITCYMLSTLIYSIYSLYKNKNVPINEYLTRVSTSMFKNSIMYGLLSIGLLLISLAFIALILDGKSYILIARIQILLFGLFYIPKMFFSLTAHENEVGKFIRILIKYVLGTLVFVAFGVIYIYMFKILILLKMPSNKIYRITAALFVLGCPIWTLVSYFKDGDLYEKINNRLPYIFIPFIFLQTYSIGIRIARYGLTPARYVCIALIIFEIIYLVIYHYDKEKLNYIFHALIAIILISILIPYINMFKLSEINQYYIVKTAKNSINSGLLTEEKKQKASSAYMYLIKTEDGKKLMEKLLSDEEKQIIIDNYKSNYYIEAAYAKRLYASINIQEVNISGYNKLYKINESLYSNPNTNFDKYEFEVDNKKIKANIKPLIKRYQRQTSSDFDEYFKNNNEYIINDNLKLILDYFSISYNESTNEINSYSFSGYILER